MNPNESYVKEGTFLYDGQVECRVKIVLSPVHYGTGDYEDPPEVRNDIDRDTYYVWYESTTERERFNSSGGGHPSLAAAMQAVESAPGIGGSVKWKDLE